MNALLHSEKLTDCEVALRLSPVLPSALSSRATEAAGVLAKLPSGYFSSSSPAMMVEASMIGELSSHETDGRQRQRDTEGASTRSCTESTPERSSSCPSAGRRYLSREH
ncbi:hypothetical protein PF006_g20181 [Phytophthora fragariae]|uniref:Uncharacterized protein n=1 Tax=Phytophthora fragariae TaxID=53985 RepID=A0A6A3DXP6_9STRA|nr:hypothetical protein PF003_g23734 [Phytophthora fragariae]KAE8926479.1 hypothetical protein PF009_g23333 [Phytophthora fragariae]KAE9111569.1 hypothetical protein PF006_g20181 [Phytophthora fragariae]KAE9192574.1 hypothetical protein PF004_g21263 [Phytophthora fragariae]KAE9308672.1 hypothetical protein PF008_g20908 [Phytophthora fragariae]